MTDIFHWITLAILWFCILVNWRDIRRRRRADKEVAETLSKRTGLTPLQLQVATDAGVTAMMQRIHEMRKA